MNSIDKLNATLELLRRTARRAKGPTFTLNIFSGGAVLQGARGKTVAAYEGTPAECRAKAEEHAARVPGATLEVYE